MKIINKVACVTVVGAALFGMAGTSAASAATAGGPAPAVASAATGSAPTPTGTSEFDPITVLPGDKLGMNDTRGFNITNLSSHDLRLDYTAWNSTVDQMPAKFSVIRPGDTMRFEVGWVWPEVHSLDAHLQVLDENRIGIGEWLDLRMTVDGTALWTNQSSTASVRGMPGAATGAAWKAGAQEIFYGDAQGTQVVTGEQAQQQAQLLNRICLQGAATCSFAADPHRRQVTWTGWQQIGESFGNNLDSDITKEFTVAKSYEVTQNLEIAANVKASILKIVEVSLNTKFATTDRTGEVLTDKTTLKVLPGKRIYPVGNLPIIREVGDFTIKFGNTTWILQDVTFDVPDPSRHADKTWTHVDIQPGDDYQSIDFTAAVIDASSDTVG